MQQTNTDEQGRKENIMQKTRVSTVPAENRLTVNANTLASMLDCGRATAVKIGTAAGARVQIGTRVLFKVSEVERYINEHTGKKCQEGV